MTVLEELRREKMPEIPALLQNLSGITFQKEEIAKNPQIEKLFPKSISFPLLKGHNNSKRIFKPAKVGVIFSGGPAPGGHNVVEGLFDALETFSSKSSLVGFLGGPSGLIKCQYIELTKEKLKPYRNQGGFDLLGTGRTKIETEEQLKASLDTVKKLNLDGLVIIGGDDSNSNAAILAEYFLANQVSTCVIGVPKTIDGDLQSPYTPISFGFDTACKTYAEMIGNIMRDVLSTKKYYHFIKLMGRSASHITLECALKTCPNYTLIGEEVAAEKKTLNSIVKDIADLICKRAELGHDYGVILIPEGLIEFIPEMNQLIQEMGRGADPKKSDTFNALPENIQKQLLYERDPHGNIQLSLIETERLLIEKVSKELAARKDYKGKFVTQSHFLGYEGRCAFPSNFDSSCCYALGLTAALLIDEGVTGYMSFVSNLTKPIAQWQFGGVPLTSLIHLEERKGVLKPVIKKTLVDLKGKPFNTLKQNRIEWAHNHSYQFPGPIQFFGPPELTDTYPIILDT